VLSGRQLALCVHTAGTSPTGGKTEPVSVTQRYYFILCVILPHVSSYMLYRVSQEEGSIFWEAIVPVILRKKKKKYIYMCPIPNDFRDGDISLYSSKIVDKKEILRTVSNTGIYCSSGKVGTVHLVQYISENSTVNISALCNCVRTWRVACLYSVQCTVQ
jgi:hypothetical protein